MARAAASDSLSFRPEQIQTLAESLSRRPFVGATPASNGNLDYDAYRRIAFRRERALWADAGLAFRGEYFPCAYIYPEPVSLYEVSDGQATPIAFDVQAFDAPADLAPVLAAVSGYSGFRLQNPINDPRKFDEIAVFQGASYFRSLGRDQGYGLSARGVAIGCGERNEEFPGFRAFWIERPAADAGFAVVHALLDGPSLTGAYRFVITPGDATVFDVEATLYPRRTIANGGLGAQSSMFLFGAADRAGVDDPREAVHDSDGLEILTGEGRRIWRPLTNPRQLQISTFEDTAPRGFGLVQRARDFAAYSDNQDHYERRPSLWVEPLGDWGRGAVHLVEIPTALDTTDNIAAFWRPAEPWTAGQPVQVRYRLHWGWAPPVETVLARAARTATGSGGRLFAIDFAGLPPEASGLKVLAETSAGQISPVTLSPLPAEGGSGAGAVRASFRFTPPPTGAAELQLRLFGDVGDLSETWRFRWTA